MTALNKTFETTPETTPRSKTPKARIKVATVDCQPVASAAQLLQLHLETTLCTSIAEPEPAIEKWPRRVRAAILAGSVILPWSIIAFAFKAAVR